MVNIRNNKISGAKVFAIRVRGDRWLIYKLIDDTKRDKVGNRTPLGYTKNRKEAYLYVKSLEG